MVLEDLFMLGYLITELNRFQYVSVNNQSSVLKGINVGVPQGSILGPLVFLIYVNVLSLSSAKFKFVLFADYTGIVTMGKNIKHVSEIANHELIFISKWYANIKLVLNVIKTQCVYFELSNTNSMTNHPSLSYVQCV